jgi:hypothetical protein
MAGRPAAEAGPGCVVLTGAEETPDTLRIALPGAVDPTDAPVPRNDSERILFGHMYETLFTVDCDGGIEPLLASDWYIGDGGRRWTFVIRDGAEFWDGDPVRPRDIVACWQRAKTEPLIWEAGVDSVAVAGENSINVYFAARRENLPLELSLPLFNIAKTSPGWPLGTASRAIETEPAWSSLMFRRPFTLAPLPGSEGPVLVFIDQGTPDLPDPRDMLEGRVDVLITRSPDVIEYASARPHLETVALPWTRTYILLSTARVMEIRMGGAPPGLDSEFTESLARDVVPGVARGHDQWSAGDMFGGCGAALSAAGRKRLPYSGEMSRNDRAEIVYDTDDAVARVLAERIVGLGASGAGSNPGAAKLDTAIPGLASDPERLSAKGLKEGELAASLSGGGEFAYIISIPFEPPDPCVEAARLAGRAKWLGGTSGEFVSALLPLVDTRMYAIVRAGKAGFTADRSGGIRIAGARTSPGQPGGR